MSKIKKKPKKGPMPVSNMARKLAIYYDCTVECSQVVVVDYIIISGGPLSALTCCVNVRLLSGDKKNIAVNLFSKLGWELGLYYASYDDFHPDILARMYT